MARHRARKQRISWLTAVLLIGAVVALGATAAALVRNPAPPADPVASIEETPPAASCATLRVVTASSFEPVLTDLQPALASGEGCVHLEVATADGRTAEEVAVNTAAHVWIPDDNAWAGVTRTIQLDPDAPGAGTVVATSPIYLVTDSVTAARLGEAGGGWLDLAELLTTVPQVRLVVRDPAGSGDGLLGVGGVGEAVWIAEGMDASAEVLMTAFPAIRTVADHALPTEEGEVGLVAEYALATTLANADDKTLLAGTDHSVRMRYTWLPTANAADDPDVAAAMDRLLGVLTGDESADARAAAGLRGPAAEPLPAAAVEFPALEAAPFDVLGTHHVDHVFSTWYADDRRSDVLLVIDISGSMAAQAPGSTAAVIDVVRDGMLTLVELLPDDSQVALWQFGAQLDPPRDYVELLPRAALGSAHRQAFEEAAESMVAIRTGTGLYDTTLAAYLEGQDSYRVGTPNHVIVFTDGRNEDRPGSITVEELAAELEAANDPARPVQLTVITFGEDTDAELLAVGLEPVQSYIAQIATAQEVRAVFIHLAAGGRH
jgi:hypothetical protein